MTITNESTNPPATSSPSFFQRICCCCSNDLKEPPVQLIRSGSLTYQQGATVISTADTSAYSNNVISAAKSSVDDEFPKDNKTKHKNTNITQSSQFSQRPTNDEEDAQSVNMNDLLMENVLKTTEEDRTEAVEEDNVSISTNVVQEVNESELKSALSKGNDSNESDVDVPKLKGRSGISKDLPSNSSSSEDEGDGDDRKMSVIEFIRSEAHAETSTVLPSPTGAAETIAEKSSPEATQSEMSDSEEEQTSEADKQSNVVGMSSKTTARAEKNSDSEERHIREFKEFGSDESLKGSTTEETMLRVESDEEEEEEEEEDVPPPLPTSPPPRLTAQTVEQTPIPPPRSPQKMSLMYANADDCSSDESSDDDESGEAHPVTSSGLVRMQPVNFAPHRQDEEDDDDVQSISSRSSTSTISELSGKENHDNGNATSIGVTRISVKSDGRAEIHSPISPVRVTLETDRNEVTDDEFSEKLI
uniref:Uncharacterized protein n=1 Tax=Caenorhabditis japonica TaxID=281687 RepID=A0A8R1DFV7_CAEJA